MSTDRVSPLLAGLTAAYSVLALAATSRGGYQLATGEAPVLAASLSGIAGLVYLVAAVGLRLRWSGAPVLVLVCCSVELVGVLTTSVVEVAVGGFGRSVVWSGLGHGYGYLPLILPAVGISVMWAKVRAEPFPSVVRRP